MGVVNAHIAPSLSEIQHLPRYDINQLNVKETTQLHSLPNNH